MKRHITSLFGKSGIWIAAAGLALASTINAAANYWRVDQPGLALKWRPDDSVALSLRNDQRLAGAVITPAVIASTRNDAKRALLSDPLNPIALRQLGVVAAVSRKPDDARRLMMLARGVSRHEPGTSLWLIDDSLARGDLATALRSFDDALSTSPAAIETMIPTLSAALADPGLRAGLIPYVRANRPWIPDLVGDAAASPDGAENAAMLIIAAGGLPGTARYRDLDALILKGLEKKAAFDEARLYVGQLTHDADHLADVRIVAASTDSALGPFGWRFEDQPDIGAQPDGQGGLVLRAASDKRAVVASKTLALPPGTYRLLQSATVPSGSTAACATWEMQCLPAQADAVLWSQAVSGGPAARTYSKQFIIGQDCPGQRLMLTASNESDQTEAQVVIGDLKLVRP